MTRKAALFASLWILASCATPSGPADPPPVEAPAPPACDPRLTAAPPKVPAMPAGASIVQPATIEERIATALFLTWVDELGDVARQLFARAELARQGCTVRVVGNPPP